MGNRSAVGPWKQIRSQRNRSGQNEGDERRRSMAERERLILFQAVGGSDVLARSDREHVAGAHGESVGHQVGKAED